MEHLLALRVGIQGIKREALFFMHSSSNTHDMRFLLNMNPFVTGTRVYSEILRRRVFQVDDGFGTSLYSKGEYNLRALP